MKLMGLVSGSSGNSTLIQSDNTNILVDGGISRKRLIRQLNKVSLSLKDIDGIVVTHEHSDHIKGLNVISRNDKIPIYATQGTLNGIINSSIGKGMNKDVLNIIEYENEFMIGDINIKPFKTFHDTNEPCAYTFTQNNEKLAVMTDTGTYDSNITDALKDVNTLLIESNHDVDLLKNGDYPQFLKTRILSGVGHLSNDLCSQLLCEILHDNINEIVLGHLSIHHNTEDIALQTTKNTIDSSQIKYSSKEFKITVAKRNDITKTKN